MGVESTRRPPLPAPTESSTVQPSGGEATPTDIATDVSRRTDHTSVSIPEDGSPVTITTKKRGERDERQRERPPLGKSQQSQTSLLIEYFEAGKGPNVRNRPSVRVKVTPSAQRKIKGDNDHIQITEAAGNRKPSYTRRISLGPKSSDEQRITYVTDDRSISSLADESTLSPRYPPVEIEVMRNNQDSDVSNNNVPLEPRYAQINPSEISSMPADSMLEGEKGQETPKRQRSRSMSREEKVVTSNTLKAPSRRRSRSLSKERIAAKAVEILGSRPKEVNSSSRRKHGSSNKARSRSIGREQLVENVKSPRRRTTKHHHEDENVTAGESSLATDSMVSPRRKSGDQISFQSGTSRSSVNKKTLEKFEGLIRDLILPELSTLKKAQKAQLNRDNFERGYGESVTSGSNASRGEVTRRVSKHASAPDVKSKPKVVLNQDDENEGIVLSGNSIKGRKVSREKRDYESPTQRSFERGGSEETVIREETTPRRKSKDGHRSRDAAAGGVVGGILTAAALRHHDSKSSVDKEERRRRRRRSSGRSHSRSTSYVGSVEEIFDKHDIPQMPMRSDIHGSEVTRDSIRSDRTEEPSTPTASERRRAEIRETLRNSPKEFRSPAFSPANRTPERRRKLSDYSARSDRSLREDINRSKVAQDAPEGAASASDLPLSEENHSRRQSFAEHAAERGLGLSPIQSVDSFDEGDDREERTYKRETQTSGSLASMDDAYKKNSSTSIKSLSSLASTNVARKNRPEGINLEDERTVLDQHKFEDRHMADSPRSAAMDKWYEEQHQENDRYRESMVDSSLNEGSTIDLKHMKSYADGSLDASYLDKATAQPVRDVGANPEYVHTPVPVESAVASLMDPSTVSTRSKGVDASFEEYDGSELGSDSKHHEAMNGHLRSGHRSLSPLSEQNYEHDDRTKESSPRQSIARSMSNPEEPVAMSATALPDADDDMPAIGHGLDSDSDLNTNPSIIQGPIGGTPHGKLDHWPYEPTPNTGNAEFISRNTDQTAQQNLKAAAAGMLGAAALASRERTSDEGKPRSPQISLGGMKEESYQPRMSQETDPAADAYSHARSLRSPSVNKDEGYISAAPHQSTGPTPEDSTKGLEGLGLGRDAFGSPAEEGGVFSGSADRRLSGFSQGMPSPLYDSATGGGLDRIQSKDVVALMDHLTVRDAQRNARDTEILVTLVRSAAEMRNSFEDMKRFITEQNDEILDEGDRQHEDTVKKIIGGPRPQPPGLSRAGTRPGTDDSMDEKASKKQNVFKRALKGLGSKNASDLARMEAMLEQLLGEVESLKANQDGRPGSQTRRNGSFSPYNVQTPRESGYEPEGQAGTSSTGQSGYFSHSSIKPMRSNEGRKMSGTRISTVLEGDEDLEPHVGEVLDQARYDDEDDLPTPTRESFRGGSVPIDTPPGDRSTAADRPSQSVENTPKTGGTDTSRKHKSSSSSFFPKMYSRWSKTTASTSNEHNRFSSQTQPPPMPTQQQQQQGGRQPPPSEASRSGTSVGQGNYNVEEHYNPTGSDRLRSQDSLLNDDNLNRLDSPSQEARSRDQSHSRPRSPLIPSQISENPKYQAHRNSLNLQHPQPRPGPTHRYQTALEHQASAYPSGGSPGPVSPSSDQWGSNPTLARYSGGLHSSQRYSGNTGNLSPINSDAGLSDVSAAEERMASEQRVTATGPPRPPKIRDESGPLIPQRKEVAKSPLGPNGGAGASGGDKERQRDSYASASQEAKNATSSPRSISSSAAARGSNNNTAGVPQRKPTGPRPITTSGNYSPDKVAKMQRTRYRGSPNHIETSSGEDVTF